MHVFSRSADSLFIWKKFTSTLIEHPDSKRFEFVRRCYSIFYSQREFASFESVWPVALLFSVSEPVWWYHLHFIDSRKFYHCISSFRPLSYLKKINTHLTDSKSITYLNIPPPPCKLIFKMIICFYYIYSTSMSHTCTYIYIHHIFGMQSVWKATAVITL